MPESLDSYFLELINEIKGLVGSKRRYNALAPQTTQAPKAPGGNAIPSPGGYTAPIHDEWHSSGGFDLTSRRPNGIVGHQGVDMRCPAGTPIYPLADGIVTGVGTDPMGGNVINIQHANGIRTYYAHLSTARVHKGDKVNTNTVIGTVGNTGNALHTVPHLHFQVWQNNQIQDPAKYFSVPKYTNLSAEEKRRGPWLSERAKQEAQAFNMKDHVSNRRVAFSKNVDSILKMAFTYSKLAKL
jgi:murein DD-endopeptidase MepM/ murein hydrolase activator NlpD